MFRHCPGSSAMTLNGTVALNLLNMLQTSKQTLITTGSEEPLPGLVICPDDTREGTTTSPICLWQQCKGCRDYLMVQFQAQKAGLLLAAPRPAGAMPTPQTFQPSTAGIQCYNANSPTQVGFLYLFILSPLGERGKR